MIREYTITYVENGTVQVERLRESAATARVAILEKVPGVRDVTLQKVPQVGDPATIHLYNDSLPAVVVRVNKKSITVARVEWDESKGTRQNTGHPLPTWQYPGVLDQRVPNSEERYRIYETRSGIRYRDGSISVTVGKSVRVIDYRY